MQGKTPADASYRAKPVVIQAIQMTPERIDSNEEWPSWLHRAWNKEKRTEGSLYLHYDSPRTLGIATREGIMLITPNDWIILGVKGEIYPCKPDVFEQKYELAE